MKTNHSKQMTMANVQFVYKLQLLGLLGYFLAIPLDSSTLTHLIILAGAFLSLLTVAFGVSIISITPKKVLSFFLIVFIIFIQMILNPKLIDTNIIYSCFCFLSLCLMLEMSRDIFWDKSTLNYACGIFVAISLLICIYSLFPFAYLRDNGTICPYLTLNLGNANYAGMIILGTLFVLINIQQNYRMKVPFWILDTYLVYLIIKTGSRSCIAAIIVYFISVVLLRNRKIPNWLSIIMVLIPMIWVPVYLLLYRISSDSVSILGKNFFSGRQNIYNRFIDILDGPINLLFGNLLEARFQNAHNAPLAVACSVGVVGMISFYCLIGSLLYRTNPLEYTTRQNIALFSVWGILIGSSFEASLFLGGFPGVVYMYTIFVLLSQSKQANDFSGVQNESRIL